VTDDLGEVRIIDASSAEMGDIAMPTLVGADL
jgi:hypothetical protein